MSVPEAAMHKHNLMPFAEHDIRTTWQSTIVQAIPISARVQG
jgi:hypothetical protein